MHRHRIAAALALAVAAVTFGVTAAVAAPATFSATQTIAVPPASNFAGSAGGDGWSVGLTPDAAYNIFHHNLRLFVACHKQTDASPCYAPVPVTDPGTGSDYSTSSQSGMYVEQATATSPARLWTYATRNVDGVGGVVCFDTVAVASCGFTPLTSAGGSLVNTGGGLSVTSEVAGRLYAFNYRPGSPVTADRNRLLCFDLATRAACPGQPYAVLTGADATAVMNVTTSIAPPVATIAGRLVIPVRTAPGGDRLFCFDPVTATSCAGTWPVSSPAGYGSDYQVGGAAFPVLSASGTPTGLCLPTSGHPCFGLDGSALPTPPGVGAAIASNWGYNSSGVTIGPRVYVPNMRTNQVSCYDYATSAQCPGFPKGFSNLSLLYTVNPDPQRPTCLWVNSDNGAKQIQNFDAFTGGACGQGPVRVLASSFIVDQAQCRPTAYKRLQVVDPPRADYTDGTVQFLDGSGNPLGVPVQHLDATGTVDLSGISELTSSPSLPQFLVTLDGQAGQPSAVTVRLTWVADDDPACVKPGTDKYQLVVTANDKTREVGAADPAFDYTVTGFHDGDDESVITTPPTCAVEGPHDAAGTYPITCSGAVAGDYTVVYRDGTLTVAKAATVIRVHKLLRIIALPPSATLSRADNGAPVAGQPVTFSAGGHTICQATTNSSGTASCPLLLTLAIGPVTATYAGNAMYEGATDTR